MKKIINDWIKNYGNYKKEVWDENILSKRIIAWISNADLFLDKKEDKFHKFFTMYLIKQVNFLKKKPKHNFIRYNQNIMFGFYYIIRFSF